jgi:hypothetical protein
MNEFLSQIARQSGLDITSTEKGVGALLMTIKQYTSHKSFSKICEAIPDSVNILSKFQSIKNDSSTNNSDLLNTTSELINGDSEELSTLLKMFSKSGYSLENIIKFLPVVFNFLKTNGKSSIVEEIENIIPNISHFINDSKSNNLMNNVLKFF